jgi:hypothetical protein
MTSTIYRSLQFFLWFICAFHGIVGLSLNIPLVPLQTIADYYGARVDWTPQFLYIVKPVGAFMLVLGGLAGVAALAPMRHGAIVYGFVALFTIRALQRLVFQQEVHAAFAIAPARNLGAMVFFFVMAVALLMLYRHVERQAPVPSKG